MSITNTLVLDNGSHAIKLGFMGTQFEPQTVPNLVGRNRRTGQIYMADEIDEHATWNHIMVRSPFEKGYITNWDLQLTVWDRLFSDQVLALTPLDTRLVVTEPLFNLENIQSGYDEILFEEFGFAQVVRAPAVSLAVYNPIQSMLTPTITDTRAGCLGAECIMVVDLGHAATYIAPLFRGKLCKSAIRKIDVGGKLLTNYLKETVSFRQWNMMEETGVMGHIKETSCFVTMDLDRDLNICKRAPHHNAFSLAYVLPNLTESRSGYVKSIGGQLIDQGRDQSAEGEQILMMDNERFTVPEVLLYPSDIGIRQKGLAEAIVEAVSATPVAFQGLMYANIVIIGGGAGLPGLRERLMAELRPLVPEEYLIRIGIPDR
ncbi:Actin- protein 6 [Dispira simplex]|nr:Actin- protein 6 [Dispira simplex]